MILLLSMTEDPASGGHGAEHAEVMAFNWMPFVTTLVVFAIVLLVLRAKVWPLITSGLDERQRAIREAIDEAEAAREEAREALDRYQQELGSAQVQAAATIAEAKTEAKQAAEALLRRNEVELQAMKQRAAQEIDHARLQAIGDLHEEAASLAIAVATKILQREIDDDDQQRLVDESLQEFSGLRD